MTPNVPIISTDDINEWFYQLVKTVATTYKLLIGEILNPNLQTQTIVLVRNLIRKEIEANIRQKRVPSNCIGGHIELCIAPEGRQGFKPISLSVLSRFLGLNYTTIAHMRMREKKINHEEIIDVS